MDLDALYSLRREGIKLGLEIMQGFAPLLGNPQDDFQSVHVAGTNGKGSTSVLIYNILRQQHSTGLYTSPHLIRFNERIFLDLEMIDDGYISEFLDRVMPMIRVLSAEDRNPTFFEATTMLAFDYFSKKKAEYAAVEVGLGGRLDSTNILDPEVSVICNIGYEHFDKLGCSLDAIAFEKGGIIKKGKPFVLADNKPEVVRTLRRISELRNAPMYTVQGNSSISNLTLDATGTKFDLQGMKDSYRIESRLLGDFQVRNIAASVLASELIQSHSVEKKAIEKGIREAVWPARMEIISSEPFILVDCAHNPPAARAFVNSYKRLFDRKPVLLLGMLSDKDWYTCVRTFSEIADEVIFTTPSEQERALDPYVLERYCGSFFKHSRVIPDLSEAYDHIRRNYGNIVVTGSIYLVGKVKEIEGSQILPYSLT